MLGNKHWCSRQQAASGQCRQQRAEQLQDSRQARRASQRPEGGGGERLYTCGHGRHSGIPFLHACRYFDRKRPAPGCPSQRITGLWQERQWRQRQWRWQQVCKLAGCGALAPSIGPIGLSSAQNQPGLGHLLTGSASVALTRKRI